MDSLDTEKVRKRFVNTAVFREVCLVVAGAFGALAVFSYLPLIWPAFGEYSAAFVAAAFIYLPALVVWRQKQDLSVLGVIWPEVGTWRVVAVVLGVIFPLFAVGFFGYHRLLYDRQVCVGVGELADWPEELTLGDGPLEGALVVAPRGRGLLVHNRGLPSPVKVSVAPSTGAGQLSRRGVLTPVNGGAPVVLAAGDWLLAKPEPGPATVTLDADDDVMATLPGGGERPLPYEARRGYWWLLSLFFVQFILIALPEEIFFRGYLQTRLQALLGRRLVVLGGDVGPAVWLTSVLFALSHLVAIPSGHRLAVFFPSLLFGWLRDRTGSVAGAVVAHALSNGLMQVLLHWLC
jgi:membrane protease YdiL (CAAX protease family)